MQFHINNQQRSLHYANLYIHNLYDRTKSKIIGSEHFCKQYLGQHDIMLRAFVN